ncbi:PREDICTED: extensin-like [Lupinus angustifolius]|uniref:extensin-like n=1 Tax=Lupinus angustifolius TaxID=3871 RepID=UPI00092F98C5|nr:PREDICTED: extensin-like [Lupinus angustifolius]
MMSKVFAGQTGEHMEVYMDDMIAKSLPGEDHVSILESIFQQLRKYNMRLNPEKCTFGVEAGKFLGFLLTSRGIEANPSKCQAIIDMRSPRTVKEEKTLAPSVLPTHTMVTTRNRALSTSQVDPAPSTIPPPRQPSHQASRSYHTTPEQQPTTQPTPPPYAGTPGAAHPATGAHLPHRHLAASKTNLYLEKPELAGTGYSPRRPRRLRPQASPSVHFQLQQPPVPPPIPVPEFQRRLLPP